MKQFPKHKFRAVRCERDDKKFASKMERSYYDSLIIQQKAGSVLFFLRQVPFELPGKVKYVCDFLVFLADGSCNFIDVKGKDTPLSIAKRKMVESLYPVNIEIIKKI